MSNINWKLVVFWVSLWYFVYSAPTEGVLSGMFLRDTDQVATGADDF